MRKIFYLSTCDTCKKMMSAIDLPADFIQQDIKKDAIQVNELEGLKNLSGSYESLFSRRARLFTQRNLKEKQLSEEDYKSLILEHYTFLKRPVLVNNDQIFIGASKKTQQEIMKSLDRD